MLLGKLCLSNICKVLNLQNFVIKHCKKNELPLWQLISHINYEIY